MDTASELWQQLQCLRAVYRNSHRMVQSALAELFDISMSLGTVNKLRLEASNAIASCVDEAKHYIQQSRVVGADETSTIAR